MKELQIVTFTDKPLNKDNKLVESCATHNLKLNMVTLESEWTVNAQKIKLLNDFLVDLNPDTVLMVVDAFDVYINGTANQILEQFESFKADLVFSAEANYYLRNPELRSFYLKNYPESPTVYRYLNSGTFIGSAGVLRKFLNEIISSNGLDPDDMTTFIPVRSDQYLYGKHFVDQALAKNTAYKMTLDYRHELFEVAGGRMRSMNLPYLSKLQAFNAYKIERFLIKQLHLNKYQDVLTDLVYQKEDQRFYNRVTKTSPLVIHLPGTWQFFDRVMAQLLSGKRTFSVGRLFASLIGMVAYLLALFIPIKIRL